MSSLLRHLLAVALGLSSVAACTFDLHDVVRDHDASAGSGGTGGSAGMASGGGGSGGTGAGAMGGTAGSGGSAPGGTGGTGTGGSGADAADAYQPGTWCASQQPVALCAEFPTTNISAEGFPSLSTAGGSGDADPAVWVTPPYSAHFVLAGAGGYAYLRKYWGTPNVTSIRMAFSVRAENAGASGSEVTLVHVTIPSPRVVHVRLASDGTLVFRDSEGVDGGAANETTIPGSSALGAWRRVEVDLDVVAKTAKVLLDGTQVLSPSLIGLGAPTTVDNFYVGFDFAMGGGPWDVHLDDVIFDMK